MSIRQPIVVPGGIYGDALPTGERVATTGEGVIVRAGQLPPYFQRPLYPRISFAGRKVIGQGSQEGTVLWTPQIGWFTDLRVATGESGAIFDHAGDYHIIQPGPDVTSQGYRYVNEAGQLVLGDDTLHDEQWGVHRWTKLHGILVGQDSDHGAILVYQGVRYELEPGRTTFIRFTYNADGRCAVTLTREDQGCVKHFFFHESEIPTLPRRPLVVVPGPQPTPPAPTPEEPPMPTPVPVKNLHSLISNFWRIDEMDAYQERAWARGGQERGKGLILLGQLHWLVENAPPVEAALGPGWKVFIERYRNPVPGTSLFYLPDQYLIRDPNGVIHSIKVIIGADEETHRRHDAYFIENGQRVYRWIFGVPGWMDLGVPGPENFTVPDPIVDPATVDLGPSPFGRAPAPTPPTPPAPPAPSPLEARMGALERDILALRNELSTFKQEVHQQIAELFGFGDTVTTLQRQIDGLRIENVDDSSVPEIETFEKWRHAHKLRLRIVRGDD